MKIITTKFKYAGKPFNYDVMHDVFVRSCKKEMPDVEVVTIPIDNVVPKRDGKRPGCLSNTVKLEKYCEYVQGSDDDLILADCDMLCVGDAERAFRDYDFDIAITVKGYNHKSKSRINGGIIFVRNSPGAKAWIKEFTEVNRKMYEDKKFHDIWMKKYFGMNQAALGYMMEEGDKYNKAETIELPTVIWNNCDPDWGNIREDTVFIHIKSSLRTAVFSYKGYKDHEEAMALFYNYIGNPEFSVKDYTYAERKRKERRFRNMSTNPEARTRAKLRVKSGVIIREEV